MDIITDLASLPHLNAAAGKDLNAAISTSGQASTVMEARFLSNADGPSH